MCPFFFPLCSHGYAHMYVAAAHICTAHDLFSIFRIKNAIAVPYTIESAICESGLRDLCA